MRITAPSHRTLLTLAVLALVAPLGGCATAGSANSGNPASTTGPVVGPTTGPTALAPGPSMHPRDAASAAPSAAPESSASPTPERTSPLTGEPEISPAPVLVVKLDNTHNAQPHAGLEAADLVYLEEVEYGITRIAAVFSSRIPDRIGPVRSARITDIDLLAQFDSPAFAFSGAQHKLWPAIAESPLIDTSPNKHAGFYQRDRTRRAPYNYFFDGSAAVADIGSAGDISSTHDIGFTFSDTPPDGGSPNHQATMRWGESAAKFTYDDIAGDYRVNLNGKRAQIEGSDTGQRASTVIIQNVKQEPSKYFDKGGGNTPHADTIGSGTGIVLRDGFAYDVLWNRPDGASGTTFTRTDGSPMPFKPGQQWIVLLNRKTPATLVPPTGSDDASTSASPSPSR